MVVRSKRKWYPARIVSLPTIFDNKYEIEFDVGGVTSYVSVNNIARMPTNLPKSDDGYTLNDSTGEFTAKTTRGGSSTAKKSRKSYRKKRRKSYKRK